MRISLSNGGNAIVDNDLFNELSKWRWNRDKDGYARRSGSDGSKNITILMHRSIIGACKGQIVDHINRRRLDNRRCNLRIVNVFEHAQNRSDGYFLGVPWVTFHKKSGKFMARRKSKYLGVFDTLKEAARAVKREGN